MALPASAPFKLVPKIEQLHFLLIATETISYSPFRRSNHNGESIQIQRETRHLPRRLGLGSELEAHEPDFHLLPNVEAGFENQETCLLRLRPTQLVEIFPPQLHRYIDPKRYRYAVIGTNDDTMYDLIPPRSLVEVDVMQSAVHMAGWTSVLARPIYLVGYGDKYSCCWCQVQGSELTLLPHPLSQHRVRSFKLPKEASVVGRVTNWWRLS
jgi:hypothetical protein